MDETRRVSGDGGGDVLAGRYELRGRVGSGGMADVMVALDRILGREVAVKILHRRYADDDSFLARFRREAQAAASLSHPNVVQVYDTGEDDARPFIVMEYIRGSTLRALLRGDGLAPRRAAEIAGAAARGLHYAHERGIVHRDVKPGNILVSDEGDVKVADFGIARAVDADNATQTAAVFGTAAYIAPEQAQGAEVDRRTDVYGLGCVLYEMLTGRTPFAAESPVALAYKHISEEPVAASQLRPDISPQLDAVVMRSLAKQPADRYQSAKDLAEDLDRAVAGLAVQAPAVGSAAAATTVLADPDATRVVDRDATVVRSPRPDDDVGPAPEYERRVRYAQAERSAPPSRPRRRTTAGTVLLVLLVLAVLGVLGFVLASVLQDSGTPEPPPAETVTVPPDSELINVPVAQAKAALEAVGLVGQELPEQLADPGIPAGNVLATNPVPGAPDVELGSAVELTVSSGPATTTVPDVSGQSVDQATASLAAEPGALTVGEQRQVEDDTVEEGLVIGTDPAAGTEVGVGSSVVLLVSAGRATITVPEVEDLTEEDARDRLANFCDGSPCLETSSSDDFSDTTDPGRVVSQDPPAGTEVEPGSTVTLVVSLGASPPPSPSPSPSPSPEPTEPPEESDPPEESPEPSAAPPTEPVPIPTLPPPPASEVTGDGE